MRLFAILVLGTALVAHSAAAETRASKEEMVGVGAGSVVGALAGGPFGFVVGAGIGGWFGDRLHRGEVSNAQLQARLELAKTSEQNLAADLDTIRQKLAVQNQQHRTEQDRWTSALAESVNLSVLFRTGETELTPQDEQRLGRLADLLKDLGPSVIHIEGHADPRGNEEFNAQLSAERAASVRDTLIRGGIDSGQISVAAYGEEFAAPEEGDLDGYALERRVDIYLTLDDVDRLAQRH